MIVKLFIRTSLLTYFLAYVTATSCHELQKSQLNALNERINQMIETISSLLPKSIKKLEPPVLPAPATTIDYTSHAAAPETVKTLPPALTAPVPIPNVVYVPSPYAPMTMASIVPSIIPNGVSSPPRHYMQSEIGSHLQYPYSTISVPTQLPKLNYLYEQLPNHVNAIPTSHPTPTYSPGTYSLVQSQHPTENAHSYFFEYTLPASAYPNIPAYTGLPAFGIPMQIPPGAFIPAYQQLLEPPQKYT